MQTTSRDLRYYRGLPYTRRVRLERDDGGDYFVAYVVELSGLESDGLTEAEARYNLQAAFDDYIEALLEEGITISEPKRWPASVAKKGMRRGQMASAIRRFIRRRTGSSDETVSFDQHLTGMPAEDWLQAEPDAETSGEMAHA